MFWGLVFRGLGFWGFRGLGLICVVFSSGAKGASDPRSSRFYMRSRAALQVLLLLAINHLIACVWFLLASTNPDRGSDPPASSLGLGFGSYKGL